MLARSRALPLTVLLAWMLAFSPGAARATYTGVQNDTSFGTVAAGGGWIAVPQYEESNDPGSIDGSPFSDSTSSIEVARVSGPRFISFKPVQAKYSITMGPMLLAGGRNVLAVAWTDTAAAGQIDTATLNASGNLPAPHAQTGQTTGNSLALAGGPDGAYAVSWSDSAGAHAMAAPAGASQLTALLGPGVPLDPTDHVVLSGGDSFWLVNEAAGGLSAAPALFGQDSAPPALTVSDAVDATTLGDDAGGLWALARGKRGWFAAHVDRAGRLSSTALPAGASDAAVALAGTTAVVAYRAGPRCTTYVERIRASATRRPPTDRSNITPRGSACSTPKGVAVDPSTATAYVLMQSRHSTVLTTQTTTGTTSSWHGSLTERLDAIVAAGSNQVIVESNGPQRNLGEQCGGASPSFSQSYFFRVFRRAHLERSGRLDASIMNC